MGSGEPAIGRRVAQWRVLRRMTQQMLADRLGKSKSWVDKVERGVRALDRFSVIQDVAEVLRVDAAVLLGDDVRLARTIGTEGVRGVRAALACYDIPAAEPDARPGGSTGELHRRVEHAWLTYQHAHYPQLTRLVPTLLADARSAHATVAGGDVAGLLRQVYRIVASLLVKLGEPDVAWLAADRATALSAGDPVWAAVAAVPLGQALRAAGQGRLAMAASITAAHRIAPSVLHDAPPQDLAVCGTLLVEAALAAATCGDHRSVTELLDQAAEIAERVDGGQDHHRTGFGAAAVRVARVAAAVELGDGGEAVAQHTETVRLPGWRRLPVEHRAAHLVDAARAYLQVGDLLGAGRALVEADRIAPAEVRVRPLARTVIAEVARGGPAPAGVAHLAAAIGLIR
ncbi:MULTISPECIES: helix-turn-helix domain-containing protein [Micromonospora]|uniref:helix-turn-helix domain-containing protein n=1 Tax=Micromonospora TaxID=1873 RepID=UPI0009CC87C0|nr:MULTISPECIES: helix-turn-helix domain-containing protein [unclassified Micromonospora]MDI5937769.1 helix-turn-helix domain-containing protein [Micromonospora sp. DH15]OON27667.1 transcriptional regulator [Micromonospora sp. Rc5]